MLWHLSKVEYTVEPLEYGDTLGTKLRVLIKEVHVLISEVVLYTLYVAGTPGSVLIREVSFIRRSLIERFH